MGASTSAFRSGKSPERAALVGVVEAIVIGLPTRDLELSHGVDGPPTCATATMMSERRGRAKSTVSI
jgi:hypothetical protein